MTILNNLYLAVRRMLYPKLPCLGCGRFGVQLWRPYGEFFRPERLRCAKCAEEEQGKPRAGYSIGWYVPCLFDTDGTVWGYTSAPPGAIKKWEALDC